MSKPSYFTTTLPYVNAEPHIGHALELVQADILARFWRSRGDEVFFNTGTDEHGQKIWQKAVASGLTVQAYVDQYATQFRSLLEDLNLDTADANFNFIRTTDPQHIKAAQEFWRRSQAAGDIYKKFYKVKYCVGCELEKQDSDLVDGQCPLHPTLEIELIEEENYFFRFSKYQEILLKLYAERPDFVVPATRLKEIKTFVERGLDDFSISRLAHKMPWGIPVPNDSDHVMYVWFDALVNYVSAIGWPDDQTGFDKWWLKTGGVVQLAGKDNLRQQAAMWQAMLASAGLPFSRQIMIHGFMNLNGQKISKSTGNIIWPNEIIGDYGVDALRYFYAREASVFEDSDFTREWFKEVYNANLANGLGNLVNRVMKMAEAHLPGAPDLSEETLPEAYQMALSGYQFNQAADLIWAKIGELDRQIQQTEPFKLVKTDRVAAVKIISELVAGLHLVGRMLEPILPATAAKIRKIIQNNRMPEQSLFPRKD